MTVKTEPVTEEKEIVVVENSAKEILPINAIWHLPKEFEWDDIPRNPNPFFIPAQEGWFLRKATALGFGTILMDNPPRKLGKLGFDKGVFEYEAPLVPAELCSQILDFFQRIWEKHHAEAEVILTARIEVEEGIPRIKEWRPFIPTQKVSTTGVESAYDPAHIAKGHQVVGTVHSHCNFGAFHSGTDTNDARGMDGLHMTIGHVDKPRIEVAAMVSVNGMRVNYDWSRVADFNKLGTVTAPKWWDNYVTPSNDVRGEKAPVGMKNFEKFKTTGSGNSGHTRFAWGDDDYYSSYGNYGGNGYRTPVGQTDWRSTQKKVETSPPTKTLADLRKEDEKSENTALLPADTKNLRDDTRSTDGDYELEYERLLRESEEAYWEDKLDKRLKDLLFDNILTDDDLDGVVEQKTDDKVKAYLRLVLLRKLNDVKEALELMGVDVSVVVLKTPSFDPRAHDEKPKRFKGKGKKGKR